MTERKITHGPGPETKGGGFHGGPKRWTGRGPAPARHIPWPEIFKHHISVVEGHFKMIDMVRKHTLEGSGNWRMIMELVDRTREMLRVSKHQARTFIPPSGQREQVPLGSSSASMYPGYSPADHEYGKAAEDYGRVAAEARKQGVDIKHPDVEYEVGQAKGIKRRTLAQMREAKAARGQGSGSGSGSGSEGPATQASKVGITANGEAGKESVQEVTPAPEGENPYFVIDTKPMPVNKPGISSQSTKRSASPSGSAESKKHKKTKKHHDSELPKGEEVGKVEFEDISEEVDARMKAKEEKKKRKEEKKRKRERKSGHAMSPEVATTDAEAPATAEDKEKPKRKKTKKSSDEELADRTVSKKRRGEENKGAADGEGKKNKRRKLGDGTTDDV